MEGVRPRTWLWTAALGALALIGAIACARAEPAPAAVQELAARSASQGTPVKRVEMPYTTEELQGAIIAVVDRFTQDGVSYRSVGGSSEGFVTVSVPDDDPALQEAARVAAAAATDVPVRIVPDEGPGEFDALELPTSGP